VVELRIKNDELRIMKLDKEWGLLLTAYWFCLLPIFPLPIYQPYPAAGGEGGLTKKVSPKSFGRDRAEV
jgi:hypothetical protein